MSHTISFPLYLEALIFLIFKSANSLETHEDIFEGNLKHSFQAKTHLVKFSIIFDRNDCHNMQANARSQFLLFNTMLFQRLFGLV
mgnify:CR=1 FL=1